MHRLGISEQVYVFFGFFGCGKLKGSFVYGIVTRLRVHTINTALNANREDHRSTTESRVLYEHTQVRY